MSSVIARISLVAGCALALGPGCALPPPTSYTLPACTSPGQIVTLSLDTGTKGPPPPQGQVDPIWTGISPRADVFSTTSGPWFATGSGPPRWIQYSQAGTPQPAAAITYTYGAPFRLPMHPANYTSITITGVFGADNHGTMKLNGTTIASCTNCFGTPKPIPALPAPISPATSLFNWGQSLVLVEVVNLGSVSGLFVKAAVQAVCP